MRNLQHFSTTTPVRRQKRAQTIMFSDWNMKMLDAMTMLFGALAGAVGRSLFVFGFFLNNDACSASVQNALTTLHNVLVADSENCGRRGIFSARDVAAAMLVHIVNSAKKGCGENGEDRKKRKLELTKPPTVKWMAQIGGTTSDASFTNELSKRSVVDGGDADDEHTPLNGDESGANAEEGWMYVRRYCGLAMAMYTWPVYLFHRFLLSFFGTVFRLRPFHLIAYRGKEVIGDGYFYRKTAAFLSEANFALSSARDGGKMSSSSISIKNLHYASWVDGVWQTPFVVLTDDATRAIVVVIRGSTSLFDWITDASINITDLHRNINISPLLTRDYTDGDGSDIDVHEGMLLAALCIYGQVVRVLASLKNKHPEYRIVITGHSLGAGVASLLTLLLRRTMRDEDVVGSDALRCYAFSPPGCMVSRSMLDETQECTLSFVVGDDIVPRLSYQSMGKLRNDALDELSAASSVDKQQEAPADCGTNDEAASVQRLLYPPGHILHFVEDKDGAIHRRWITADDLQEIVLSRNTFADHMAMRVQRIVGGQRMSGLRRKIPFYSRYY